MKKNVNPNKYNSIRIGFDFDGVIIDHSESKVQKAQEFGFNIKLHQIPSDRLKKIINREYYRRIQEFIYGPGTPQAPIIAGADKILKAIKRMGYEMFIISRRHQEHRLKALSWINRNLPGIFNKQKILFTEKDIDKDKICQKLDIQVYIDDKITVLQELNSVPERILYDPYDIREDFELKNIQPVSSWDEFWEYLKSLSIIDRL